MRFGWGPIHRNSKRISDSNSNGFNVPLTDGREAGWLKKKSNRRPFPRPTLNRYLFLIIIILLIETAMAYFALDWAVPAPEVVEEEAVLEELDKDVFVVPIFYEDLTEMDFSPLDTLAANW